MFLINLDWWICVGIVGSKQQEKVNKYPWWLHDIYLLSYIFFLIDNKYERGGGDNKKYLSKDRAQGNIGFFKWLVMKIGKSSYRWKILQEFLIRNTFLWKSWMLHTYSRNYVRRCRDKFPMVFEIWNQIGNLIDDQKNLIIQDSLSDLSIKGNVGISYKVESRNKQELWSV